MQLNPYIAGNPLKDPSNFFGRDDIVREVMQMLNHPDEKAIVLFGQRRIGKTTILLQIDKRLTQEGSFTPVYFDLQDRASSTLTDVLYKLAQSVAYRVGMSTPPLASFDDDGHFFMKDFLPDAIRLSAPNGIVILFDEFDVMDSAQNNQAGRIFFPYLRNFISQLVRVKFVFVIGRRPEELSTESLSTFKGIRASRVSLLDRKSTEAVIRQSEIKSNMHWSDEAVEQVWKYTQGHTFFTQLLCNVIWEKVEENSQSTKVPIVFQQDVDNSVQDALKQGANAFHWIWNGLPPAERVVMAAMAEVGEATISQDQIEDVLNRSGVRLVARELKIAPMTLVEWDLLHPIDKDFRFAVPLLQKWVRENRPLARVKEELDRLDPLAENLYKSGQSFYGLKKVSEATQQLRQALIANPNHLKSRLLLARILLEQGSIETIKESLAILEEGYKYDEFAVGADLIKTLFAYAETYNDDNQKLDVYERILSIQPNQPVAKERRNILLAAKGEAALRNGDQATAVRWFQEAGDFKKASKILETERHKLHTAAELALQKNELKRALELFQLVGEESRVKYVTELIEKNWIDQQIGTALQAEKRESWEIAVQTYVSLLERYPDNSRVSQLLKKAEDQAQLAEIYKQALEYMNSNHVDQAQNLFAKILALDPSYKDTAFYLYETIYGSTRPENISTRRKIAMLTMMLFLLMACSFTGIWVLDNGSILGSNQYNAIIVLGLFWTISVFATVVLAIILFRSQKMSVPQKRRK